MSDMRKWFTLNDVIPKCACKYSIVMKDTSDNVEEIEANIIIEYRVMPDEACHNVFALINVGSETVPALALFDKNHVFKGFSFLGCIPPTWDKSQSTSKMVWAYPASFNPYF